MEWERGVFVWEEWERVCMWWIEIYVCLCMRVYCEESSMWEKRSICMFMYEKREYVYILCKVCYVGEGESMCIMWKVLCDGERIVCRRRVCVYMWKVLCVCVRE